MRLHTRESHRDGVKNRSETGLTECTELHYYICEPIIEPHWQVLMIQR